MASKAPFILPADGIRLLVAAVLLGLSTCPSLAALPFKCEVSGDTWRVTGTPDRRGSCSVVCILVGATGDQDKAACAFTAGPSASRSPLCEGFLTGRRWTSGTLVSAQCSYEEP